MATLVSSTVTETLTGTWPQVMTIVQEFDSAVIVTEDFEAVFYTERSDGKSVGEMASKPLQYVANQLVYTMQVSPFANGKVGLKSIIGGIQDFYGNAVDLKIGDDFAIYNTNIKPYFPSPRVFQWQWTTPNVLPQSAVCPGNTPPQIQVITGPYNPNLPPMAIPEGMWNGGNFYLWVNYTFKPDQEAQGIPFVWEPPFYYAYSGFGFPLNATTTNPFPPAPIPYDYILYNVCSSGAASQGVWDTCGWIDLYPKWQGKVQVWAFGDDVFGTGVVPWTFPGVANPTGDLSPQAQFGFPQNAQEQFYLEYPFTYVTP